MNENTSLLNAGLISNSDVLKYGLKILERLARCSLTALLVFGCSSSFSSSLKQLSTVVGVLLCQLIQVRRSLTDKFTL